MIPAKSHLLDQSSQASFHVAELAFDYPEWVLHFRTHLRLGFFDFALGFVEHAAFAQVLVDAADSWLLVRMQVTSWLV